MMTRRELVCRMTGASKTKMCRTFEMAEIYVRRAYPKAHKQGSAGGWSWVQDGECVAATAFIEAFPPGRHWLALKPKPTKPGKN